MARHSGISDTGELFKIIPSQRKVSVPPTHKALGTVGEHNAEQVTFQTPRTIDGHDVANCSRKYVSWENADGTTGAFEITDVTVDEDYAYFKWVLEAGTTDEPGITAAPGQVSFSVHFEDRGDSDELLYHWGTTICSDCQVLDTHRHRGADVVVPSGYTKPSGTERITKNGTYNVTERASVEVHIEDLTAEVIDGVLYIRRGGEE